MTVIGGRKAGDCQAHKIGHLARERFGLGRPLSGRGGELPDINQASGIWTQRYLPSRGNVIAITI